MRPVHWLILLGFGLAAPARADMPIAEWQYSAGQVLQGYFQQPLPTWQGLVSAGPALLPSYEGSSAYRTLPGLTLEMRYRDLAFASTAEGLGVNLLRGRRYRAGLAAGFDLGRDEDDDPRLRGLGDIDPAAELKLFGEYVLFPVVLRADLRRNLGSGGGWSADLAAYLPVAGSERYFIFLGPSLTVSDGEAMGRSFGITAPQATRSQFPAFEAGGGLRSAAFGFSATWFFRENWFLNGTGGLQALLGSAADSPLSRSDQQYSLSLMLGYRW